MDALLIFMSFLMWGAGCALAAKGFENNDAMLMLATIILILSPIPLLFVGA